VSDTIARQVPCARCGRTDGLVRTYVGGLALCGLCLHAAMDPAHVECGDPQAAARQQALVEIASLAKAAIDEQKAGIATQGRWCKIETALAAYLAADGKLEEP